MPFTVWLTGLPASGKTTILCALAEAIEGTGMAVERLDSDYVDPRVVKDLGTGRAARDTRARLLAFTASRLNRHGVACVAAASTPRSAVRAELRGIIGNLVEVFVSCPLSVAEERDPKGLYAIARRGLIPDFTGVGEPYEEPQHPDITVYTDREPVEQSVQRIYDHLVKGGYTSQ